MHLRICLSSCSFLYFFFFSSRRRHTRYWRDWSSDVCSSDLPLGLHRRTHKVLVGRGERLHVCRLYRGRSEERRVGKECRLRRAPDHFKKKRYKSTSRGYCEQYKT